MEVIAPANHLMINHLLPHYGYSSISPGILGKIRMIWWPVRWNRDCPRFGGLHIPIKRWWCAHLRLSSRCGQSCWLRMVDIPMAFLSLFRNFLHIYVYISVSVSVCIHIAWTKHLCIYTHTHTIIIVFTHTLDFYTSSSPRSAFTSLQNVGGVGGDLGLSQVDARDLVGLGDPMGIQCGEIARDNLTTVRIAIKGLSLTIHIIWSPWLIISIILVAILVSL